MDKLGLTLSKEQKNIIKALKDSSVAVTAYAGSAKSTTAIAAIIAYPKRKFLYLTFSRKLVDEMDAKCKELSITNVDVRGLHSLAMRYTAHRYGYKLNKFFHFNDIQRWFPRKNFNQITEIKNNLEKFCLSDQNPEELDNQTLLLWERVLSSKKLTYSAFAKQFVMLLQQGKINLNKYDIIILDELQDLPPVFMHLIRATRKSSSHLVLLDKHQAIYDFLLDGYKPYDNIPDNFKHLTLSTSYRCSKEIAEEADKFLKAFMGTTVEFKGVEHKDTKIRSVGLLTRTNAEIIDAILKLIKKEKSFNLKGEIDAIFKIPIDVEELLDSDEWKDCKNLNALKAEYEGADILVLKDVLTYKYNKREHGCNTLEDYFLKHSANIEARASARLYKQLKKQELNFSIIKRRAKKFYKPDSPIQILTIHASKGLSFDQILFVFEYNTSDIFLGFLDKWLSDNRRDIRSGLYEDTTAQNMLEILLEDKSLVEELNLLYVAYTRARHRVLQKQKPFVFDNRLQCINTIDDVLSNKEYYRYFDVMPF
jgi:superfamily I DNA/RNA helicase